MREIEGVFVFRIPEGKDLIKEIEKFASENNIICGEVKVIGALKNARIGYYDPKMKKYVEMDIDEQVELLSAMGNISLRIMYLTYTECTIQEMPPYPMRI